MARTVTIIKKSMTDVFISDATIISLYELTDGKSFEDQFSVVSLESILFYIIAFAIWTMETIQDIFTQNVNDTIANLMPHTGRWYRSKALMFQYGFDLVADTDVFNNESYTTDQIEGSKIVKYAAVNESTVDSRRVLLIKIAKLVNNDLAPLSDTLLAPELAAFTAYMQDIKDAGVPLIIYNREADKIKITVDFYYNPLLLDGQGNRLDGLGEKPVPAAALNYLLNLPFNGEFSNARFVDALQAAYGCADSNVFLILAERKKADYSYDNIDNTFIPDAGYVRFDTNGLTINYIPYVAG